MSLTGFRIDLSCTIDYSEQTGQNDRSVFQSLAQSVIPPLDKVMPASFAFSVYRNDSSLVRQSITRPASITMAYRFAVVGLKFRVAQFRFERSE